MEKAFITDHAMDQLSERFNIRDMSKKDVHDVVNNDEYAREVKEGYTSVRYITICDQPMKAVVEKGAIKTFLNTEMKVWTERKMTLQEIAESLRVSVETIRSNGKKLFPFEFRNGVKTYLNEEQVTAIKMKIEKHHNLQTTLELPKTELEELLLIQQGYNLLNARRERLEQENKSLKIENATMAPKAEFYDQVTDSTSAIDIGTVANVLNIKDMGRNKLFAFLRARGVLKENNQPYRQFIDRGYFRIIEQKYDKPDGSTNVNFKTVVYQSGVDYIRKLIEKENINE